jgi:hypothetical protein
MRKGTLMFLVLIVVVVAMAFSGAGAGCAPGTVGGEVFAAAGGDPTGGQLETALGDVDTALDDVEAATGQDIPVC